MNYIKVGKVYTTHGLKGELKIKSDFPLKDKIYSKGMKFYFGDKKELYLLNSYRKQNDIDLLLFENLDTIDKGIKYRGIYLYIDREDILLPTYLDEDLLGFEVIFNEKTIGFVKDIYDAGKGNKIIDLGDIKIPNHDNFVDRVDLNAKKIYIKNGDGLL